MPTDVVFRHNCTILDACCSINLHESGYFGDILTSMSTRIAIADYVLNIELKSINLFSLTLLNWLEVATLDTEAEEEDALHFMTDPFMDDGEAITGAIALNRNWAIATDEAAASAFFEQRTPQLQILSTPELIKYWVDIAIPSPEDVRTALQNVEVKGRYKPHKTHRLYSWWQANR